MKNILFFLLLLVCGAAMGQSAQEYFSIANTAYQQNDNESFLENIRKADELRPNHPAIVPRLAMAWTLNGRKTRAIQTLNQLMLMDATFDFKSRPEFESLKGHKGYDKLVSFQKELSTIEENDEVFLTADAAFLHPESFVVLDDGSVLLGSIREKKIVKVNADGQMMDWADLPFAVLGMKADFEEGHLWVSTAALPEMKEYDPANKGTSVIVQLDLATGQIIQGIEHDESIIGDIYLDKNNRIWLSNSMSPFLVRDETDTSKYLGAYSRLQFDLTDTKFSLQGLALTDDEKYIYVSDYVAGLFRVDIEKQEVETVFGNDEVLLKGIDGLYYYKNNLIAVHNGVKPYKVMKYELNESGKSIVGQTVINRGGVSLGEPTLGQVKDGYFYYLANSPWPAHDGKGNFNIDNWGDIEIRRIKLD